MAMFEGVVVLLASLGAGIIYERTMIGGVAEIDRFLAVGVLAAVLLVLLAKMRDLYDTHSLLSFGKHVKELALIWVAVWSLLLVVGFALKIGDIFSRGAVFTFAVAGFPLIVAHRAIWSRVIAHDLSKSKLLTRPVALITFDPDDSPAVSSLRANGLEPVHLLRLPPGASTDNQDERLRQFYSAVRGSQCREIYVAADWNELGSIPTVLDQLRGLPMAVRLMPIGAFATILDSPDLVILSDRIAFEVRRAPLGTLEVLLKRMIDAVVAFAAIILLSPIMLATAIAVKLDSPGPVFFRQTRVGLNGHKFQVFKFRSMSVLENGDVVQQARAGDPRITRIGWIIRRSSIDELPQLFNVLMGDMSLVGPRPHALAHDKHYEALIPEYAMRRNVKPGITGWAQVNGHRGETPTLACMQARVDHDLWYIDHWSVWLDLKIILMTCFVVFTEV